jgi:hypothetical protein
MPYKLRDGLPSSRANTVELTDFIELECLKKGDLSFSFLDIIKTLDTSDDYQEDEVDEFSFTRDSVEEPRVDDALNEVELRFSYCNSQYPFTIENNKVIFNSVSIQTNLVYIYLLLATRLYMGGKNAEKVINKIDGTLLFEELCEKILQNYWGERSETFLFGTAENNRFEEKIGGLIKGLKEGGSFRNLDGLTPTENDGTLDVAVWKKFSDRRGSQILGFAQCKTGNSWDGELRKLDTSTFVDTWFTEPTTLTPTNVFMVADVVRHYHRKLFMNILFFDRCRLMDYLPQDIDRNLLDRISTWVIGALGIYEMDHTRLGLE